MILPPLQGNLDQLGFFIYAAGDSEYFQEFGPALIGSVQQNTTVGLHLHLYNPTPEQIKYCRSQDRVSVTFESAPLELFNPATQPWLTDSADPIQQDRRRRMLTAMSKGQDPSIQHRLQRTYFACARFIRLQQLIRPTASVLAIDIDAVVRKNLPTLPNITDFYIHHISGRRARYLAGGIYLTGAYRGYEFLSDYAKTLQQQIEQDSWYWGIDQDVLDTIVPKYRWEQLPSEFIDWEMLDRSCIWTAKGTRKNLDVFKNEQKQYSS
jgi:hypothetical protein